MTAETQTYQQKYPFYLTKKAPFQAMTMLRDVNIKEVAPPMIDSLSGWLGFYPANAIFTYGDAIYNPNKIPLPDQLIVHERVHMRQQNWNDVDAALWWGKFMRDDAFRIDQEAEAYAVQYEWLCHYVKPKQQRFDLLMQLARILAGPLYGYAVGFQDAMQMIRERSGVK